MKYNLKQIIREEIELSGEEIPKTDPESGYVSPSSKVIGDVCQKEKFCKKQGPITFGQLKKLVETAQKKNLIYGVGEGLYKAIIRLLPWFFPQIALAGFIGSSTRAFNKIIKPGLENTTGYKSWWGKTILKMMNLVEGELPTTDPLSKIFFISDGLLHMMDKKHMVKFSRYISEVATSKPDSEPVPEYFVENELRSWVNQKFILNPPLPPKTMNESEEDDFDWIRDFINHGAVRDVDLVVGKQYKAQPNNEQFFKDNPEEDEPVYWMELYSNRPLEILENGPNDDAIKFKWLDEMYDNIEYKYKGSNFFKWLEFYEI